MHSLKVISLMSWLGLIMFQIGLLWPGFDVDYYWVILLTVPLLFPIKGLLNDQLYTYKWIGFMTLIYFCIGISELVSNPQVRVYGFGTTICSTLLYLSSIYYVRYLGMQAKKQSH